MGTAGTRSARLARLLPALLALLLLGGACTGPEATGPKRPPPERGTPLERFDTRTLPVIRGAFCERLSPEIVELVLGEPARGSTAYASGERVELEPGLRDIAHEHGCAFRAGKAVARAWVFAPPVTRSRARALTDAAARAAGCAPVSDAPGFGRPSVATVCEAGGATVAAYHGLFGDAWLSCSLSTATLDRDTLLDRTGRWCVEVASAAAEDEG